MGGDKRILKKGGGGNERRDKNKERETGRERRVKRG